MDKHLEALDYDLAQLDVILNPKRFGGTLKDLSSALGYMRDTLYTLRQIVKLLNERSSLA